MTLTLLDMAVIVLTQLGGAVFVTGSTSITALWLWLMRQQRRAVFLVSSVAGAALLNILLKSLFQRERPLDQLISVEGYSFPSGHAMSSMALSLALVIICWRTKMRWVIVGLAVVYVLVVGFSRVYLNVHYVSDVLAGWVFSGLWVYLIYRLLRYDAGHGK